LYLSSQKPFEALRLLRESLKFPTGQTHIVPDHLQDNVVGVGDVWLDETRSVHLLDQRIQRVLHHALCNNVVRDEVRLQDHHRDEELDVEELGFTVCLG
jgi:hypothetical protein